MPVPIGLRTRRNYVEALAAVNAAPTLASLNFSQGDIAGGGLSIVATGTNCSGVTSVTILGASVAPSGTTPTTVTFALPAHAAGTGTVALVGPGGTSGTLPFEYWSPVQVTGVLTHNDSSKGVTSGGGLITQWLDQVSGVAFNAAGALRPTLAASVFGSLSSVQVAGGQKINSAGLNVLSAGMSLFHVGKTSTSFAAAGGVGAPGPIISAATGAVWGGWGYDSGAACGLYDRWYNAAGTVAPITLRGSGLNDGNVRMVGVTSDTTPNRKLYVGTTQQGATDTPAGGYDVVNTTFDSFFGDNFAGGDFFTGDTGAIITVNGVISGGDLTKLNAWSQQRFGTP